MRQNFISEICLDLRTVVLPGRLGELHPYLDELPELPLTIDHAGLLERGENSRAHPFRGIDALVELARYPKVAVKWGHVSEWSAKPFPYEDTLNQLRRVVGAYGASRVMWESDWTQTLGHQTLAEMLFSIKLSDHFNAEEKRICSVVQRLRSCAGIDLRAQGCRDPQGSSC